MSIEANPKSDTSADDQEVLRNVYEDQMRDYQAELLEAERLLAEHAAAHTQFLEAVERRAYVQGQMDALRMIAARDGVTLKKEM